MIYFLLFVVLLFGSARFDFLHKHKGRSFWLCVEWLMLVSIVAFRYKIGGDTLVYMDEYEQYPRLDQLEKFKFQEADYKPLWYVLCALCKSINESFAFFQLVHAVILNTVIVWFLKKNTKWVFTGVFLYGLFFYLNFNTEILRASLAVCVFLLGYKYLLQRRWIIYLLLCVIAYGFHTEALAMLIMPICLLLSKIKIQDTTLFFFIAVSMIVLVFLSLVSYLDILEFLASNDMEKLERYGSRTGISISGMGIVAKILYLLPCIIVLYVNRKQKGFMLKGFLLLYLFVSIQSIRYHVLTGRMLDFLKPLFILSIADTLWLIYGNLKDKTSKLLGTIFLALTLFTGFYQYFEGSWFPYWKRYYPYSSVFEPEENPERERLLYMYRNNLKR